MWISFPKETKCKKHIVSSQTMSLLCSLQLIKCRNLCICFTGTWTGLFQVQISLSFSIRWSFIHISACDHPGFSITHIFLSTGEYTHGFWLSRPQKGSRLGRKQINTVMPLQPGSFRNQMTDKSPKSRLQITLRNSSKKHFCKGK